MSEKQRLNDPRPLPAAPAGGLTITPDEMKAALEKTFASLVGNLALQNKALEIQSDLLRARIVELEQEIEALEARLGALNGSTSQARKKEKSL